MDRFESLTNTLSQVTMYDIKSMYNQAKNMVLNVTEMEAKVREATNDDPWGASSTLMQEIAQGTFNFQQFNEIMPCIYSRFMDKEARQWREIYKSLQLLEYIIKHGSERVVDDARSHISTIKMLRNFHYIDDKGKDQGINVRNRAKELAELLMDVDRIRTERRKAKANRNKYVGTGNDPMSFSTSSGGRYGGFGSDSVGGSRSYGGGGSGASGSYDRDYGGYSGGSSSGFRDDNRRGFDEYNAGDDEVSMPRRSNSLATASGSGASAARSSTTQASAPPPAKAPEKVVDLLGFGDEDDYSSPVTAPAPAAAEKALPALASNPLDDGDDDFDDFQAAPPSAPISPAPTAPTPAKANMSIFDALGSTPQGGFGTQQAAQPQRMSMSMQSGYSASPVMSPAANRSSFASPVQQQPMSPSVFGGAGGGLMSPTSPPPSSTTARPAVPSSSSLASATSAKSGGGFDDLWSMSLGSAGAAKPAANNSGAKKSIKDLEKEKAQASIWGGAGGANSMGNAFNTGSTTQASSVGGGNDDLLL